MGNIFSANGFSQLENALERNVPSFLAKFFFVITQPKEVRLRSPVLGVIEKGLLFLVFFYVIQNILKEQSHLKSEIPTGLPTFDFIRKAPHDAAFNDERNKNAAPFVSLPYCSNEDYSYYRPIFDAEGNAISPIKDHGGSSWYSPSNIRSVFNDANIGCEQLNFAEIIKKDSTTAQLTTYQVETLSTVRSCDSLVGFDCDTFPNRESSLTTVLTKYSGEKHFKNIENQYGTESCACLEKQNSFSMAPEYVGLEIYHDYQGSEEMGYISGTTTIQRNSQNAAPHTYIKRRVIGNVDLKAMPTELEERLRKPIPPGEAIKLSFNELLQIAGCDLDDNVPATSVPLLPGQPAPKRRTTGVRLKVEFEYDVNADSKSASCTMYVSFVDGLTSWSKDAQMHQRQTLDQPANFAIPPILRQYSELTNRGVFVQFSAHGKIKKFDLDNFLDVLVRGLVMMGPIYGVILFLATNVVPGKKVFKESIRESVDFDELMSKAGISAALIAAQFEQWKREGKLTPTGGLTLQRMTELLSPIVDSKHAKELAEEVLRCANKQNGETALKDEISLVELVKIVTGDVMSFRNPRTGKATSTVRIHPQGALQATVNAPQQVQMAPTQPQLLQQPQPPQQASRLLTVACPAGAQPGQLIRVQAPTGLIQVQVPPGAIGGAHFQVQY